jgi:hypothetical protein
LLEAPQLGQKESTRVQVVRVDASVIRKATSRKVTPMRNSARAIQSWSTPAIR